MWVPVEAKRGHMISLELELQVYVSHLMWVLEFERGPLEEKQILS